MLAGIIPFSGGGEGMLVAELLKPSAQPVQRFGQTGLTKNGYEADYDQVVA